MTDQTKTMNTPADIWNCSVCDSGWGTEADVRLCCAGAKAVGGSRGDSGSNNTARVWAAKYYELLSENERLQRIIDSRPAINATLPERYIEWSRSIYLTDAVRAGLARGVQ